MACCRDLRVACKTPYSGLDCRKVEAFCSDDASTPVLSAWTAHVLHHSECASYRGVPYQFVSLQQLRAAAAAPPTTQPQQQQQQQPSDEAALLKLALLKMEATLPAGGDGNDDSGSNQQRRAIIALSAIAAGAVCVAVVAVVFAMRREESLAPITSAAAPLRAANVYQALTRGKAPTYDTLPASCPPSNAGQGMLQRDGSAGSSLSAAICIGKLSSSGGGVREPLLQQGGLSRWVPLAVVHALRLRPAQCVDN